MNMNLSKIGILSFCVGIVFVAYPLRIVAGPLGLPPVPIPSNNPQTPEKIKLGEKLYHDTRFSADGKVSCATCHDANKGFTDHLRVSKGFLGRTGSRNAPTIINAAYMKTQFWDGREPDLEGQSQQPPINPDEGGLPNHQSIIDIIKKDNDYKKMFRQVFDVEPHNVSMEHVSKAIASFERTIISGDSAFDKYQYGNDKSAMNDAQIRGLKIFRTKGRCISCHVIEQKQALFTDNRFHNIGIGFDAFQGKEEQIVLEFLKAKQTGGAMTLSKTQLSELGRFAITQNLTDVGAFKTSTLRNIAVTQPYMHDGSLETLDEVVVFYNSGGRITSVVSGFQSGGIRPLGLTLDESEDLVSFLRALTGPKFVALENEE